MALTVPPHPLPTRRRVPTLPSVHRRVFRPWPSSYPAPSITDRKSSNAIRPSTCAIARSISCSSSAAFRNPGPAERKQMSPRLRCEAAPLVRAHHSKCHSAIPLTFPSIPYIRRLQSWFGTDELGPKPADRRRCDALRSIDAAQTCKHPAVPPRSTIPRSDDRPRSRATRHDPLHNCLSTQALPCPPPNRPSRTPLAGRPAVARAPPCGSVPQQRPQMRRTMKPSGCGRWIDLEIGQTCRRPQERDCLRLRSPTRRRGATTDGARRELGSSRRAPALGSVTRHESQISPRSIVPSCRPRSPRRDRRTAIEYLASADPTVVFPAPGNPTSIYVCAAATGQSADSPRAPADTRCVDLIRPLADARCPPAARRPIQPSARPRGPGTPRSCVAAHPGSRRRTSRETPARSRTPPSLRQSRPSPAPQ